MKTSTIAMPLTETIRTETAVPKRQQEPAERQEPHYAHRFSTADAKNRFDALLKKAQENPVAITKQGKPVAVVVSAQDYEHFQRLDDAYWAARADAAFAKGDWLGFEESEAFTQEMLNAED